MHKQEAGSRRDRCRVQSRWRGSLRKEARGTLRSMPCGGPKFALFLLGVEKRSLLGPPHRTEVSV